MSEAAKNYTVVDVKNVKRLKDTLVTVTLEDTKSSLTGPVRMVLHYKVQPGTPEYVKVGGNISITVPSLDNLVS